MVDPECSWEAPLLFWDTDESADFNDISDVCSISQQSLSLMLILMTKLEMLLTLIKL